MASITMYLTAKTMCDSWFILKTICEEFKDYLCVPVTSEPLLLSGGSRCKPSCLLIRIQSTAKINQRNQLMHLIKLKDINRISCFIFYHDFKKILLFLQWQRNWQRCSTSHSYVLCMSLGTVKEKHITDFLWTFNEESSLSDREQWRISFFPFIITIVMLMKWLYGNVNYLSFAVVP